MSKKRSKFLPISGKKDSNSFIMPGRHKCDCAATKHELINNCTSCGRIVCSQEGSGLCCVCGELVCTNEDFQMISNKSNRSQAYLQQLLSNKWPNQNSEINTNELDVQSDYHFSEDYKLADERKQRLLEFDRTSARRTKVIDDEKDYYQTEGKTWMNPKEKELLRKKEKELREKRFAPKHSQKMKFSLDMCSGKVTEEQPSNDAAYELFEEPTGDSVSSLPIKTETKRETNLNSDFLTFIDSNKNVKPKSDNKEKPAKVRRRIQDSELQEIRDEGMCLSMRQPWASLLVAGVKKHEGRSWFTNHRGRLWIAATAKKPQIDEVTEVEKFYINRGVPADLFPTSYPVGCILGCVNVVNCLSEDDYLEMYPDGESGSQFVFICDCPHELKLKFPIKGKHKIYKLESHVHNAAKSGLFIED